MVYFECLSLLFTFPVGGVGNQAHKLWMAVSFSCFHFFFHFQFSSLAVLLTALVEIELSLQRAWIQLSRVCEQGCCKTSVMVWETHTKRVKRAARLSVFLWLFMKALSSVHVFCGLSWEHCWSILGSYMECLLPRKKIKFLALLSDGRVF